jgi:hypothetical protein
MMALLDQGSCFQSSNYLAAQSVKAAKALNLTIISIDAQQLPSLFT